jgi:hypothetical protein
MSKSKKIASKKWKTTMKKQKGVSEKDLLKLFKQRKEKATKFKYNVRKDSTMKKCHNFCKNDWMVEQYKNVPTKLKSIMNKSKIAEIPKKELQEMDFRLCKRNFCNEGCHEGFDFFGIKEQQKKFQKNFSKKLYNGFVDTYSTNEVEMLKKKGALSGCVKPSNHNNIIIKNKIPVNRYNVFHK